MPDQHCYGSAVSFKTCSTVTIVQSLISELWKFVGACPHTPRIALMAAIYMLSYIATPYTLLPACSAEHLTITTPTKTIYSDNTISFKMYEMYVLKIFVKIATKFNFRMHYFQNFHVYCLWRKSWFEDFELFYHQLLLLSWTHPSCFLLAAEC